MSQFSPFSHFPFIAIFSFSKNFPGFSIFRKIFTNSFLIYIHTSIKWKWLENVGKLGNYAIFCKNKMYWKWRKIGLWSHILAPVSFSENLIKQKTSLKLYFFIYVKDSLCPTHEKILQVGIMSRVNPYGWSPYYQRDDNVEMISSKSTFDTVINFWTRKLKKKFKPKESHEYHRVW